MKLIFLLYLSFFTLTSFSQIILKDSFELKGDFKEQINKGMRKYHNKYRTSDLYNINVDKNPIDANNDSITYKLKLITKGYGSLLWDAKAKFSKIDNKIVCEISQLKIFKIASMTKGVDYANIPIEEMGNTKEDRFNVTAIKEEVKKFFRIF